jgi:PleD family two-component response regulator
VTGQSKDQINNLMLQILTQKGNSSEVGPKMYNMIMTKFYYLNKGYNNGNTAAHPSVLLVDDSEFMLKILKKNFENLDVQTEAFSSPYEALDCINERLKLSCELCRKF